MRPGKTRRSPRKCAAFATQTVIEFMSWNPRSATATGIRRHLLRCCAVQRPRTNTGDAENVATTINRHQSCPQRQQRRLIALPNENSNIERRLTFRLARQSSDWVDRTLIHLHRDRKVGIRGIGSAPSRSPLKGKQYGLRVRSERTPYRRCNSRWCTLDWTYSSAIPANSPFRVASRKLVFRRQPLRGCRTGFAHDLLFSSL
jgi:hypothetical protein